VDPGDGAGACANVDAAPSTSATANAGIFIGQLIIDVFAPVHGASDASVLHTGGRVGTSRDFFARIREKRPDAAWSVLCSARDMRRRTFLTTGALALCGAGVRAAEGQALPGRPPAAAALRQPPLAIAPVDVSFDRIIRTTVGLRPHRDSGFVVKTEKMDDHTVVHDYGHGGAGMSLAWGTGSLAADLARKHQDRRAAVLGCGSTGLTAARQLQRRGFAVTIYAASVPPDTTSNMSLAAFTPASGLVAVDRRTPAWDAQFRKAVDISYRELQRMVGRGYGVYWIDQFTATDDPDAPPAGRDDGGLLADILKTARTRDVLGPGEHPFPTRCAIRTPSLSIEPDVYLDRLVADFRAAGGHLVRRTFESAPDVTSLPERLVVNCTGLGSRTLFDDRELVPVKGQLSVLIPQPEVRYRVSARLVDAEGEPTNVSMNPRSDGIVIGNLQERGSWSLDPSDDVRDRNMAAAMQFFRAM
jgi:glycine/D-amino acid oxidase-like deaminating enzyme